jgi:hypothetical protein
LLSRCQPNEYFCIKYLIINFFLLNVWLPLPENMKDIDLRLQAEFKKFISSSKTGKRLTAGKKKFQKEL